MSLPTVLWTVGHSNHDLDAFVKLILAERVGFLVDVRSYPYSRFAPHFNGDELQAALSKHGIRYLFLGDALGGRPDRDDHYDDEGRALYGPMSQEPEFQAAIGRLLDGARSYRLALLCSCGQPRDCHRRLLVGKVLCEHGCELRHILPDGCVQVERSVDVGHATHQRSLLGEDDRPWRSAQSVSHRRRLSTSSVA